MKGDTWSLDFSSCSGRTPRSSASDAAQTISDVELKPYQAFRFRALGLGVQRFRDLGFRVVSVLYGGSGSGLPSQRVSDPNLEGLCCIRYSSIKS